MDGRSARGWRPALPAEVRAHLHRWIEEDPGRAERIGMRWVRRYPGVLETGDALSMVHEAAMEIAALADRVPVFLDGAPGLVARYVRWVALHRVEALRPRREIPLGLGLDGGDELDAEHDDLSMVLAVQAPRDLGEEDRGMRLLAAAEHLARRSRAALPRAVLSGETGVDGPQLLALRGAAAAAIAATPLGAGAALRQRMRRGRQAVLGWVRDQARTGPEREVVAVLTEEGLVDGERGRAVELLDWIGLPDILAAIPTERLSAVRRARDRER